MPCEILATTSGGWNVGASQAVFKNAPVRIELPASGMIEFHVFDAESVPIPNAEVFMLNPLASSRTRDPGEFVGEPGFSICTDRCGVAVAGPLRAYRRAEPLTYDIVVSARGYSSLRSSTAPLAGETRPERIDLHRPRMLSGKVLDNPGRAIAGAQVQVIWLSCRDGARSVAGFEEPIMAGAGGDFSFAAPDEKQFCLKVSAPGHVMEVVHVRDAANPQGLVAHLAEGLTCEGDIVDEGGTPVHAAHIQCFRDTETPDGGIQDLNEAVTDDLGRFRIDTLGPGPYTLLVATDDYMMKVVEGVRPPSVQRLMLRPHQ